MKKIDGTKVFRHAGIILVAVGFVMALCLAGGSDGDELEIETLVRYGAVAMTMMGLGYLSMDISDRLSNKGSLTKRELKKASYARLERQLKLAKAEAEDAKQSYLECFDAMYAAEREVTAVKKDYQDLFNQYNALYAYATGAGLDIPNEIAS